MGHYTGPKVRLSRRLGVPIADTDKHRRLLDRGSPGGRRFGRRRRPSLYRFQLDEKQKLAFHYDVRSRQLRRYLELARRRKGSTAERLHQLLETRLDNAIRRLGWARTIWQARQIVSHGHVNVDGRRVDRPGYPLQPGQTVSVRSASRPFVARCAESAERTMVPGWLSAEGDDWQATVTRLPGFEDTGPPFEVDYTMVIEFYSR